MTSGSLPLSRREPVNEFRSLTTPVMTPNDMNIRRMTRGELDTLVEWAALEGWNPGLNDAEVFWATDPEGFVAAEIDGELIGGGSIVAYEKKYGFIGLFIVRTEYRGRGVGNQLWHELNRRLLARLDPDAALGLDGVFNMQHYYARGGFRFVCRDLRFEGRGMDLPKPKGIIEVSALPFESIDAYDQRHFPAPRRRFLQNWIKRRGGHAVAAVDSGEIRGYAVMRPCR